MSKTAMIRARTDPHLKREAEKILYKLGISATEAINIFYRQVKLIKGLPFEVRIPNEATLKAMVDVEEKRSLVKSTDIKDMLRRLEA